jgi:hypothetical protein
MRLLELEQRALEYVRNTGGGATKAHFMEDHEPIGARVWDVLVNAGFVSVDEYGRIRPTDAGLAALTEPR